MAYLHFPMHGSPHWSANACKLRCRVGCPQNTHQLLKYSKYSHCKMLGVDSLRLWVVVCESTELFALLNLAVWCVVMYGDWWRLLQTTLERHVNGHFNQSEAGNGNAGARRSLESASSKLFRRNGKKLRYRRQPWSGRALCTGSHHQLLPSHMHQISLELPLNGMVDDAFIRRTVACMMCVPFSFGNWMYYYHIPTVFVTVWKRRQKKQKMGSEKCDEQRGQENWKMYLNLDIYILLQSHWLVMDTHQTLKSALANLKDDIICLHRTAFQSLTCTQSALPTK